MTTEKNLITPRFEYVEGSFDMEEGKLICVPYSKHGRVHLCIKEGANIPFANIKLYDGDLRSDFEAVYDDASRLGDEIAKRWNGFQKLKEIAEMSMRNSALSITAAEAFTGGDMNTYNEIRPVADHARQMLINALAECLKAGIIQDTTAQT